MPTKSTDEKKPPAGVAGGNDVNGDELLFELRGPDGQVWRLYLDGRADGFPAGTIIENRAHPLWSAFVGAARNGPLFTIYMSDGKAIPFHFDGPRGISGSGLKFENNAAWMLGRILSGEHS